MDDITAADLWRKEDIPARARSVVSSRCTGALLLLLTAVVALVTLILVGVAVGNQNSDAVHAVRRLFVQADSERVPALPAHYTHHRAPNLVVVLGDAWAAGFGVTNTADDSWWAQLRTRHIPAAAVARSANATARIADIAGLGARLVLPQTSLQGLVVAVVVQCGWNDIVGAQASDQLDQLDLHAAADDMMTAIQQLVHTPAFLRAAAVSVFIIDYPDASAGTGFTGTACEGSLSRIYNHAAPVDMHLRALNMYSQALMSAAHAEGFAFVPLRATLASVGTAEAMHTVSRSHRRPVDVEGHAVQVPVPAAFGSLCGSMTTTGQQYQADLVAAHIFGRPYYVVG